MKKMLWLIGFAGATLAASAVASPTSYSGSLSSPSGLEVGGSGAAWYGSPAPSLTWTVTETSPGVWHYRYTLTVPGKVVQRIILEASDSSPGPAFEAADLQSPALSWPAAGDLSVGQHAVVPENPGMPADTWGIQVDLTFPVMAVTLEFNSSRQPVWGDFYARTEGDYCPAGHEFMMSNPNWLYSKGFTAGDTDPTAPAANGSWLNHLLVPDSTPTIPAPGAVCLGVLGLAIVGRCRLKRL